LIAVLLGSAGPLAMIYLWLPEMQFSLELRIGGSVIGLLVAVGGFLYPVLCYLQRANAAAGYPPHAWPTLRRMLLGACLSAVPLIGTWASVALAPSWSAKLIEADATRRGLALASQSVQAAADSARSWTQIVAGVGAIVGSMAGALLCNVIGRRPTYMLLCAGALAAALLFYLGNRTYGALFMVNLVLLGGFASSFYGWLPLYLPELFPTRLRATAQGFSYNFGRIIAAVGALQTGTLMGLFGSDKVLAHANACATISLVYAVGIVIIWLVPETRGQPLPE
jgi:MFS family permease